MSNSDKSKMQGEGDYASAERYVKEKREFIESGKVDEATRDAGKQPADVGRKARKEARERAMEHDPRERPEFDEAS
jgi:hypothetical protein